MTRIVFLTGNHLCHNPRVMKSAAALGRRGYDVEVLGAWSDPELKARDQNMRRSLPFAFNPVIDLTRFGIMGAVARARGKYGRYIHRVLGVENPWQLGNAYTHLRNAALLREAHLYVTHSEQGMAVAAGLMQAGLPVGIDMEDWFSEDGLPEARIRRPLRLLRDLEADLLRRAAYTSCPSNAMSNALGAQFGISPPSVIYNAFPWSQRNSIDGRLRDRVDARLPTVHWFSQTLGHGRGLEDLVAALRDVKHKAEIHLRGQLVAGFDQWLLASIPEEWRARFYVHAIVPNDDLLSRIAEHDIGFAGEMTYCRSRDLTITNKVLLYLLAGLAVVASSTAGQREVAERAPGAVLLYAPGNPLMLADRLNTLLASPETMRHAKSAALRAAENVFCWERQEEALVERIELAISPRMGEVCE